MYLVVDVVVIVVVVVVVVVLVLVLVLVVVGCSIELLTGLSNSLDGILLALFLNALFIPSPVSLCCWKGNENKEIRKYKRRIRDRENTN